MSERNADISFGKSEKSTKLEFMESELLLRTLQWPSPWYSGVVIFISEKTLHFYACFHLYVGVHACKCVHVHIYMCLWVSSSFFISILLSSKSLYSCWQYRSPKRPLKQIFRLKKKSGNVWSVRDITVMPVKWGCIPFPMAMMHTPCTYVGKKELYV